jgi:hypothetical protein
MKSKKPLYKRWWFWLIVAIVVVGIASPKTPDQATPAAKTTHIAKKVAPPKPVDDLSAQIKSAADPHFGTVTNVEINDDAGKNDGGKIVLVTVKMDDADKTTIDSNTTEALARVFKIAKVDEISYDWQATLVDTKGHESVGDLAMIDMTKETAKTIDWNNFLYTNLDKVADNYKAYPALPK